jgi:AraC family transcriptional regulator of adaptative response/methylated-DNA-[protein]-cysteine methyltransferase
MENYKKIEVAIKYLTENFKEQPSLEDVAQKINLSTYHFQRLFTEWVGVSPKKFLQYLTIDFLKSKLKETSSILEASELAGLSSQSRVYDLFVIIDSMTPNEYKTNGIGLNIEYGYHQTPFGEAFIAISKRGICALDFVDNFDKIEELNRFKTKWYLAELKENHNSTKEVINKIFTKPLDKIEKLNLLVQGTNFQIKVWEALLKIPSGGVSTYGQIANLIDNPKASRAVGSAVGSNPISYLIPCHRVIRNEGVLGQYHWGKEKKKAMIGWEMSKKLSEKL